MKIPVPGPRCHHAGCVIKAKRVCPTSEIFQTKWRKHSKSGKEAVSVGNGHDKRFSFSISLKIKKKKKKRCYEQGEREELIEK